MTDDEPSAERRWTCPDSLARVLCLTETLGAGCKSAARDVRNEFALTPVRLTFWLPVRRIIRSPAALLPLLKTGEAT